MNLTKSERTKLVSVIKWVLEATMQTDEERDMLETILKKVNSSPVAPSDVFES